MEQKFAEQSTKLGISEPYILFMLRHTLAAKTIDSPSAMEAMKVYSNHRNF
jgi:hypothetical protein